MAKTTFKKYTVFVCSLYVDRVVQHTAATPRRPAGLPARGSPVVVSDGWLAPSFVCQSRINYRSLQQAASLCPGYLIVKVKQSSNRPDVAQRVPGGLGSQISMTFAT